MKKLIVVALFGATLLYAEDSAFDAGNLTSDSAYGLTSNEKLFKQKLDSLNDTSSQLNAKINQLNERIEGLQSMLEGINSQYSKSNSRLTQLETFSEIRENNITQELKNLRNSIQANKEIQEANNKQFKAVLAQLSSLVDSINADYVSKDQLENKTLNTLVAFNHINDDVNATLEQNLTSDTKQQEKLNDESWKKKKHNEILDLALKDFRDDKFQDSRAKLHFLIEKHYKPARATFWLGEIEYKQQNYNQAIQYYKQSSSMSTKGDYFPKLLYHTAISLDKIGDTKSANNFYKALKTNYSDSPEAKASPNRK
ncbi:hypothetical protein OQH60_05585 [Campylobacter sp. MIT 21-1685]|uniref:tetratricopeptide repeat protein n=1 Tax=unclassified Campylobacter TaxID=2593542 RepID=UPI00224B7566|nr:MULTISPECIES: tetratricopeptide repeat protein [unclassified Campylobacter]MCX2683326.1 hypothetical protein [Campylobacter sp. MIT 21-1684]MCX2751619.1 hypothetical protein [Campylobacter sp. MIT 21-1682]MCX2807818.1 hypothetical protein [Campylobacter sp. MIT 21-1685]